MRACAAKRKIGGWACTRGDREGGVGLTGEGGLTWGIARFGSLQARDSCVRGIGLRSAE